MSTFFSTSVVPNLLLLRPMADTRLVIDSVQVVMGAAVVVVLVRRWLEATRPARRVLAPVYGAGLVGGVVSVLDPVVGIGRPWLHVVFSAVGHAALLLLLAFLAGMWRVRLGRTAVADLLVRLPQSEPEQLRDLLAGRLRPGGRVRPGRSGRPTAVGGIFRCGLP